MGCAWSCATPGQHATCGATSRDSGAAGQKVALWTGQVVAGWLLTASRQ